MKTINLDALANSGHRVEVNGVLHAVRQITARVANIVAAADTMDGIDRMTAYYDAVALLLPTMPRDEVNDLAPAQLGMVIQIAKTEADAVEEAAADPNGESSAQSTASEPATVTG